MNEINTLLTQLAQTLNVSIDKLWGALLKQATVDFFATTIQYTLLMSAGIVLYKHTSKRDWDNRPDASKALIIGVSAILVILLVCAFCYIPDYLATIFNPEYWALNKILSVVVKSK